MKIVAASIAIQDPEEVGKGESRLKMFLKEALELTNGPNASLVGIQWQLRVVKQHTLRAAVCQKPAPAGEEHPQLLHLLQKLLYLMKLPSFSTFTRAGSISSSSCSKPTTYVAASADEHHELTRAGSARLRRVCEGSGGLGLCRLHIHISRNASMPVCRIQPDLPCLGS